MATVQSYFGFPDAPEGYLFDEKAGHEKTERNADIQNYGRMIGIEIEAEKVNYDKPTRFWNTETDGSLKINGLEFTIPVYEKSASRFLAILFNEHEELEFSSRCSTHIHVDIRDFTLPELKILILLYIIYEKSLYNFSGKRWDSNYCVPVRTFLAQSPISFSFDVMKKTFTKYTGVHLFAGNKYSTIEFRQMKGTKNINEINTWIQLVVSLVNYAKEYDLKELLDKINRMHTTSEYYILTEDIFKHNYYELRKQDSFKEDIEEGIRFVKFLIGN